MTDKNEVKDEVEVPAIVEGKEVQEELDAEVKTKKDDVVDDKDEDEDKEEMEESVVAPRLVPVLESIEIGFGDTVANLFEGVEGLSEDFTAKVQTVFEAAVKAAVGDVLEQAEVAAQVAFKENSEAVKADLVAKLDEYAGYVVDQWIEENAVALETGARVKVAEGFMADFKALMEKHNVALPESVDLLEKSEADLAAEKTVSESLRAEIAEKDAALFEMKKEKFLASLTEGLAETQKEKLLKLTEGVDAADIESFELKAKTIKESIFKEVAPEATPAKEEAVTESKKSGLMGRLKNLNGNRD